MYMNVDVSVSLLAKNFNGNIYIVIECFYASHQIKGLGTMGNMISSNRSFQN